MSINFETVANAEKKILMIESITMVGSAFGVTTSGAQTYINKRIVDSISLCEGDIVEALVLPNYDDKRPTVPWRALRLTKSTSTFEHEPEEVPVAAPAPQVSTGDRILALISEHGAMRTATLATELNMPFADVSTVCMGLFAEQKLAMAEVYGASGQKRASLRVWGLDINDFDVDPSAQA